MAIAQLQVVDLISQYPKLHWRAKRGYWQWAEYLVRSKSHKHQGSRR